VAHMNPDNKENATGTTTGSQKVQETSLLTQLLKASIPVCSQAVSFHPVPEPAGCLRYCRLSVGPCLL
jgi:hypothetical protein